MSSRRRRVRRCHPMPPTPPQLMLTDFNEPKPSLTSDVQFVRKNDFFFGMDESFFVSRQPYAETFWVSAPVDINDFQEIKLSVQDFEPEHASIEYSLIFDDNLTLPVLPENKPAILHEKIAPGDTPRFSPDPAEPILIKQDNQPTDLTLQTLESMPEGSVYSVVYTPIDTETATTFATSHKTVRVAITMRLYDIQLREPYVEHIYLKGYEGAITWKRII